MLHNTLKNYYETNFALMHYHKWSLEALDSLLPWEKEIYVGMLMQHLKEEERRYKEQQASRH